MECPKCNMQIRGYYHIPNCVGNFDFSPPNFCYSCGGEFPWTERKRQSALDLFLEEIQDKKDQETFRQSLADVVKDNPQAKVGASRIAKLLSKAGNATANAIRDILVDIVSESAKKVIFPED